MWYSHDLTQLITYADAIIDARQSGGPDQNQQRMYIRVGWSEKFDAPILVHGFVNSPGGPQSAQQFKLVAEAFRNWIGDDNHFEFH